MVAQAKNKLEVLWQDFEKSGSVEAYLAYFASSHASKAEKKKESKKAKSEKSRR